MVEGQDAGNEETARNRDALDVNKHVLLHQESKKLSLEMILIHTQFIKVGEHDREVGHKHLDQQYYSNAVDFHGDAEFSGNMTQVVANTQEAAQDYGIENAAVVRKGKTALAHHWQPQEAVGAQHDGDV